MADRAFLDTNILIYSVSEDPRDFDKQAVANALLAGETCVLSTQVLQEFLHRATQQHRPPSLRLEDAWDLVMAWRRFPVQENGLAVLEAAHLLHRDHHFSWWDGLIVAAAQAQGCRTLYSEDMQHGRIIGELRIVNPFL